MNTFLKSTAALLLLTFSGIALGQDAAVPAGEYQLDKTHSTVIFRADHLGFSFYTASFSRFDATLDFNPQNFADAKLTATIDVTSLVLPAPPQGFLDTLLGPDWFNAEAFPEMHYQSTSIKQNGPNSARVNGNLTLKGVTRPVTLDVQFNGGYAGFAELDPQARAGFSARGTLHRSDFNLAIGLPPKGSNMGVGDEVEFIIETEFNGPPLASP
jgi:polyisoprenoid-binding protein YceI